MPTTRTLAARRGKKGNFADQRNGLLAHFEGHSGHAERSWRESFGYERRPEKPKGGKPFIARGPDRSPSDSK